VRYGTKDFACGVAAQYFRNAGRQVGGEGIGRIGVCSSDWILVANDPSLFDTESLKIAAEPLDTQPIHMWTDDFSDLY
jgi:hypothetical protein